MKRYNDWQAAAEASRLKMALSVPMRREIPGGKVLMVQMVKPLRGDPYYTYASCPGLRVQNMHAVARDCDRVRGWEPF
jgi:hypothetical protein